MKIVLLLALFFYFHCNVDASDDENCPNVKDEVKSTIAKIQAGDDSDDKYIECYRVEHGHLEDTEYAKCYKEINNKKTSELQNADKEKRQKYLKEVDKCVKNMNKCDELREVAECINFKRKTSS